MRSILSSRSVQRMAATGILLRAGFDPVSVRTVRVPDSGCCHTIFELQANAPSLPLRVLTSCELTTCSLNHLFGISRHGDFHHVIGMRRNATVHVHVDQSTRITHRVRTSPSPVHSRSSRTSTAVHCVAIPRLATVWLHLAHFGRDFGSPNAQKKSPATLGGAFLYVNAEGMGFEPTTPCGASDFESDRWPIRLPSGVPLNLLRWGMGGNRASVVHH